MFGAKIGFCAKCSDARPLTKDYLVVNGKRSKYKVVVCAICRDRVYTASKYGNKPTKSRFSDRVFMSKKEANREPALVAMQNTGWISNLRYQVPYRLDVYGTQAVDALLEHLETDDELVRATYAGLRDLAKTVRRSRQTIVKYIADFVYTDDKGNEVVEDVKGRAIGPYRMKKKLMVSCHNVEIVEPSDFGVQQKARGAGVRGAHTGSRLKGGR